MEKRLPALVLENAIIFFKNKKDSQNEVVVIAGPGRSPGTWLAGTNPDLVELSDGAVRERLRPHAWLGPLLLDDVGKKPRLLQWLLHETARNAKATIFFFPAGPPWPSY